METIKKLNLCTLPFDNAAIYPTWQILVFSKLQVRQTVDCGKKRFSPEKEPEHRAQGVPQYDSSIYAYA